MRNSNFLEGHSTVDAVSPQISLRDALAFVAHEARQNGLSERTVRGAYEAPANSILRYLDGASPLRTIGFEEIRTMVRRCLAENLTAQTIRGNYLRVLRLAFIHGGFSEDANPVHHVLRAMRTALRVSRPPIEYFEPDELHEVLRRVAEYESSSGRRLRRRPRDLAVFRLVSFRGVRAGELERIEIARDVNIAARTMRVTSKCVTVPRVIRLEGQVLDDVVTLIAARVEGPLIEGGAKTLNSMCEVWKRRLREPRLNLRNLRRSFATGLDEAGIGYAGLQKAMGHVPGSPHTLRYIGEVRRTTEEAFRRLEHPSPPDGAASPAPAR